MSGFYDTYMINFLDVIDNFFIFVLQVCRFFFTLFLFRRVLH